MSAVAAAAVGETFGGGVPRRRLRSVPAQAGPVVPLEFGNPLQLSKTMRARLLAAVRALVSDPALKGAGDPARLAAVVLMAKAKVAADYSTRITAKELGRWVGLKTSRIAHKVLPELRERGVLGSTETTSAAGRMTGLECWVIPMYRAQRGDRRHVLALSRVELVVLLKLIEALFAPGWADKDGQVTRTGMLADRTGRGAATDRLGLLLMVLSSNSKGWLQLCSGSVDTERGRPAATAGRLLGCSPAAGAKVLARLQEQDVLTVDRRETASGLNARSRVRLLPVAQAHGVLAQEAREAASVFSDLAGSASGDHGTAGGPVTPVATGVEGAGQGEEAGSRDLAVAAHLHASHAPVDTPGGSLSLSGGFSGEGRRGNPNLPDRACEREDQAVDADAVDRLRLVDSENGPLRGEQLKKSPSSISENGNRGPVADAPVRVVESAGQDRQQQERVVLPAEILQVILEPVQLLWARLDRPAARRLVEAATGAELATVSGFVGRVDAPQVLADRLARRLEDQMRLGGPIKDPVGWLIGKGLPQRQECGDKLCDDRMLLDSGRDCPRCEDRQASSRARRLAVAAAVDTAMPYASETERRTATERQLHETVTARAWAREHEWEQVRARQAAAAKHRAETAAAHAALDEPAAPSARAPLPAPRLALTAPEPEDVVVNQDLVLEELTREQVLDWRTRAARDHQVVFDHIDRYGEHSAQRLFTRAFIADVRRLSRLGHLNLGYTTWERS